MYIPAWPYILTFFVLSFYSFLNISSRYSLLILLVGAILRLLILPFFDPFLRPYLLPIFVFFFFINILSPAPPIAASLIHMALVMIYVVKTPRKFQFGKKSAKVYHCLYNSTEQLQVALWTYMFLMFGFNNEKSLHTLPLRSVPFLSLHLYPSLCKPSVSSPLSVWLPKPKE